MPKPPTAERGRRRPVAVAPPPPPRRRLFGRESPPPHTAARHVEPAPEEHYRSRRPLVTTVLCLLGLAVASYLTVVHFTTSAILACSTIRGINCEKVISSPQSVVFGVPVAVLGLCYFVPMLVLCLPWAWRSPMRFIAPARIAGAITGVGFICYLLYAELFQIHAICLWCSSVHVITFLLFVAIVTGWDDAMAIREEANATTSEAALAG